MDVMKPARCLLGTVGGDRRLHEGRRKGHVVSAVVKEHLAPQLIIKFPADRPVPSMLPRSGL